jgi:hypothetical protein
MKMKILMLFLLLFFFVATPLLALLSFQDDCSEQICHMITSTLFILTQAVFVAAIFLGIELINKTSQPGTIFCKEVFLPPRLS